jgi:hypothetical protein
MVSAFLNGMSCSVQLTPIASKGDHNLDVSYVLALGNRLYSRCPVPNSIAVSISSGVASPRSAIRTDSTVRSIVKRFFSPGHVTPPHTQVRDKESVDDESGYPRSHIVSYIL